MRKMILTLLFAVLGSPLAAHDEAATNENPELGTCIDNAGLVDLAVRDCYVDFAAAEDDRLNRAWRDLMTVVGGKTSPEGAALLAEQRAWLAYRDASCKHYVTSSAPGTLDRLQQQICYTEIISQRADAIEELASMYLGMMRAQSED